MFTETIPSIVGVLEQCLKESDEENSAKIFEVFDTLLMVVSLFLGLRFYDVDCALFSIGTSLVVKPPCRIDPFLPPNRWQP